MPGRLVGHRQARFRQSASALERFMFLIGRIPVLKFHLLACLSSLMVIAWPLVVNAQTPQPRDNEGATTEPKQADAPQGIAVPLTAKPLTRVAELRWVAPPGHVTDRQLIMQLTRFQEVARGPWPEDLDWNGVLEKLHAGVMSAPEDTLVIPAPDGWNQTSPLAPLKTNLSTPRSLKSVAEEIIADLPPAGREAWLRLVSNRAAAEFKDAVRAGNWEIINRIASQDVHSPAGYDAIDLLGNRHLDQGRPLAAIRQFLRLLNSETARKSREPYLSIRTSAAWSRLGRHSQARLALIGLSGWLSRNPKVQAELPDRFLNDASAWQQSQIVANIAAPNFGFQKRFSTSGLLPLASEHPFSPNSKVIWNSLTSGFHVEISEEDRAKFVRHFEDEDANAEDPFPESESETAALVEAGFAHLARRDRWRKTKTLPACEPVIGKGQVVLRTLNRVRSVDLATGSLRWESFLADGAFAEQFDLRRAPRSVNIPADSGDLSNPLNRRQSAVIYSKTRHDRTTGTLSTDGTTLFAIEDCGITAKATAYIQPGVRQTAPKSTNRLCGIDLGSGILKWQIGGPEGEHAQPAAGMFFLGVPTVIDDSIYVLGEQSNWIRLLCLEPDSGKIRWIQPVATAIAGVTEEGLRRIAGISPCLVDGLVVCPTLSGLVVAFDPDQRRIAWTSNYRTLIAPRRMPQSRFSRPSAVSSFLVDSANRWRHHSIFVRAGRIVMTPLDSQQLICLDAVSGSTIWSEPRGRGMFIAAEFDHQIIVVDDSAVRSLSLKDGSPNWTVPLNQRTPTGRGLKVGPLLHLPVATALPDDAVSNAWQMNNAPDHASPNDSGRLVTIDLRVGRLLAESKTPDGQPLGNLVAHKGQLFSQRFDSVVAFESLPATEENLAKRLKQKPDDSGALESRARIRLHEGRLEEGLGDLQLAVQDKEAKSALDLLVDQSLEQLRHGQKLKEATRDVLATAELSAVQRNSLDAVRAERLVVARDFNAAFDLLLNSPRNDPKTGEPFIIHSDPLAWSSRAWITAQLQKLYEQASKLPPGLGHTDTLDQQIRKSLDQAIAKDDPALLREWLGLFSWHNFFTEAAIAQTERLDATKDALEIESLLTILSHHSDKDVATAAKERLPKLAEPVTWPVNVPQVTKLDHNLSARRRRLIEVSGSRSPVIEGWEFELSLDGLTALSPTGQPLWTLTDEQLGSEPVLTTSRHDSSRIFSSGHLLTVSTGTEFSVFDIHESPPRRLWMKSFIGPEQETFLQMRQMHHLGSVILTSGSAHLGSVDFLNSHSLVYRTGTTLRVVNATTGKTTWTRDDIQPDALIFGNEFALSVVYGRSEHCQLFDIRTGRLLEEHFDIPLKGLLATFGTDMILRQSRGTTHFISRVDMRTGKPIWEHNFPYNGAIRPIEENRLAEFHPDGRILIRETSSGETIINVQAEKQRVPGRFFLHETPTEYVLFSANAQRQFQTSIGYLQLQGVSQNKVEGPAYGIDRRTGKILWAENIEPQFFAEKQPAALPFVVLACSAKVTNPLGQNPRSNRKFPIRVLDTRTGETIFTTDGTEDSEAVFNCLSQGDARKKQASLTFGKTVIHFDYSGKPQDAEPSQD